MQTAYNLFTTASFVQVKRSDSPHRSVSEKPKRRYLSITFFLFSIMADQEITCRDCGAVFTFTEGEQEFYASKNLSAPQRCKACRDNRKNDRASAPREMHQAVCAQCGQQCEVPFKPRPVEEGGRPVLCKNCFMASRA